MTTATLDKVSDKHTLPVGITVNNKPVKLDGHKASGLDIKKAAIDQGVPIELDFHLARLGPDGKYDPVDDADPVEVSDGSEYVATAGDDNS